MARQVLLAKMNVQIDLMIACIDLLSLSLSLFLYLSLSIFLYLSLYLSLSVRSYFLIINDHNFFRPSIILKHN